jgi:hypothetical protein
MPSEMTEMTETHSTGHASGVDPFSPQDLKGFVADDQDAGRSICKMLSLFFFYTVIMMGAMTAITYYWVTKSQ